MIHPLAYVGGPPESRSFVGPGIEPVIDPDARVEAFVTIDAGTERPTRVGRAMLMKGVHIGHDALIGDGCELAPHACVGGFVEIGANVRIGMGAIIRNRAKVGDGARIGMGAVVVRDVPAGEVWVGNPARNIQTDVRIDPAWDDWYARSRGNQSG
jgi:UDP-N-acetylglucosamine acyltransferase